MNPTWQAQNNLIIKKAAPKTSQQPSKGLLPQPENNRVCLSNRRVGYTQIRRYSVLESSGNQ